MGCFPEILHLGLASTTVGTRATKGMNQIIKINKQKFIWGS